MEFLQTQAFLGKEKKGLPFIIANMHMIFNGIKSPHIVRTNTLSRNVMEIQEKDRVDVILANPPFGAKENESVQMNFPIKTSATENMFMQYFIKKLKQGGRAAIVIKNTFLTNDDNATKALRQELLTECNLHTILDMPQGTFLGAGVKTVILFFTKGEATKDIWYYQLDPGRNLGKTNSLNINDFKEFLDIYSEKSESENSWTVRHDDIDQDNYDLAVNNPNKVEEVDNRTPQEIIAEIEQLELKAAEALKALKGVVLMWKTVKLRDVVCFDKKNGKDSGLPYVGMENIASESMQLVGTIEIPETTSSSFEFDETHVLYGRLRPYLKKVLLPNFKGQCSTEVFCLKPSKVLLRGYLAYWLLNPSTAAAIEQTSTGARMPRANMNAILDFQFQLPHSQNKNA